MRNLRRGLMVTLGLLSLAFGGRGKDAAELSPPIERLPTWLSADGLA